MVVQWSVIREQTHCVNLLILVICANAWKINFDSDSFWDQHVWVTNSGQLQKLRRADDTSGQDHLADRWFRFRNLDGAVRETNLDARRDNLVIPYACGVKSCYKCVREYDKIRFSDDKVHYKYYEHEESGG